jgi:hypothetical protein
MELTTSYAWRLERKFHFSLPENKVPEWVKLWAFAGWLLIVIGVAGEFIADSFVSKADGYVQKFDEILLAETTKNAGFARDSARSAGAAAMFARGQSEKAVISAHDALNLSASAKREADSFERDIALAKQQAADAESHLAEALRQAADATAELNRLRTPRSIKNASSLVAALQNFKGTEYTYIGVFQDNEAISLLEQIDSVLQLAGWKKVPPTPVLGAIEVSIRDDFKVPSNAHTGVLVEAESPTGGDLLQGLARSAFPSHVLAGMSLKAGLASGIVPTQESLKSSLFSVGVGNSTAVKILVGRKP